MWTAKTLIRLEMDAVGFAMLWLNSICYISGYFVCCLDFYSTKNLNLILFYCIF